MNKIILSFLLLSTYISAFSQTEKDLIFVKRATSALLKVPQDSALIANTLLSEILKMRIEQQIAEKQRAEAVKLAEKKAAVQISTTA